ncbi:MAG: hypothetical protein NTX53_08485 [candidate division WOR-3 bacterium]|nr:hypothetical protein [candidate division WOR-3 bacterium]
MKKESVELEQWTKVKRLHGLTDAQVQMARELRMNPKRLLARADAEQALTQPSLAVQIESQYLRRFKRSLPDTVVPLRQALHEARARERAEARERRRRKRQAERDHLEAMRVSMLTLRRMYGGVGATEDPQRLTDDDLRP